VVTTTLEEGRPATLIDTSILTFNAKGLVATGRDYWFLEPGAIPRSTAGAADHRREPAFRPAVAWPTAPASSQGPSRAAPEPGSRSG
jgi:hypothetical protein